MKRMTIIVLAVCIALGSSYASPCLASTKSDKAAASLDNYKKFSNEISKIYQSKTPAQKKVHFKNAIQLMNKSDATTRFYELGDAAKVAVECGDYQNAQKHANELLKKAPSFSKNWNYGNAIYDGNMVLGRVALHNKNKGAAANYLFKAGKTPGSPQLNSFGPNMSLAKDLLKVGDVQPVIRYFKLCKKFWSGERGRLNLWTKQAQQGKVPNFGANLRY